MKHFIFFIVSLSLIYGAVRLSENIQLFVRKFGDYLLVRAFPSFSEFEQYKFGLLRIVFGLIILLRAINIHVLLIPEELFANAGIFSALNLVAAALVAIGLFTQWALLFLVFVMWQAGELVLGTSTLGNDVAAMLSTLFFLTGAGKYLSLDSLIMKRCSFAKRILLYIEGTSSARNIALSKFSVLVGFWALCTYSLSMHINEPAWTTGVAGPLLLTNNFMSSWYQFFGHLFASSELAVQMARASIWLMMLWYITVIPLTLAGGVWRLYVITWGVLFFILSLVVLNLGSLAEIEFVFWAAIFWSKRGIETEKSLSIFFDDKCNLCDKTIQIITFMDIFGRIKLMPISLNMERLEQLNIHPEDALNDLYGVENGAGEIKYGYDFYMLLSKTLVFLWPIFPILCLGKMLKIGPMLYRVVATRRHELFGFCVIPRKKFIRPLATEGHGQASRLHSAIIIHICFLTGCYLVALPVPYKGIIRSTTLGSRAAHYYGIAPINVFNSVDLRMAENWYTLNSADYNQLVPLFTNSGSRLAMHKSDRVYFGNTLRFRRGTIDKDGCAFETYRSSMEYLSKIYLHQKKSATGSYKFRYVQYYQPLPDTEDIIRGKYIEHKTTIRCTLDFEVNYIT
jgi:predicted DCC family thiol-disulfide oxidoreductase YuxK